MNKEFARVLSEDTFQVTAYTRLNTKAISSSAILDFAEGVIKVSDGCFQEVLDAVRGLAEQNEEIGVNRRL